MSFLFVVAVAKSTGLLGGSGGGVTPPLLTAGADKSLQLLLLMILRVTKVLLAIGQSPGLRDALLLAGDVTPLTRAVTLLAGAVIAVRAGGRGLREVGGATW